MKKHATVLHSSSGYHELRTEGRVYAIQISGKSVTILRDRVGYAIGEWSTGGGYVRYSGKSGDPAVLDLVDEFLRRKLGWKPQPLDQVSAREALMLMTNSRGRRPARFVKAEREGESE